MVLKLDLACWDYDRTRGLSDGTVRVEGVDLNYIPLEMPESFHRMYRHSEFDASEMSLAWYLGSYYAESRPFIAIPVFPSRMFRHSGIYVNPDAGITSAEDLIGKRIGIPEYQQTAGVWIRGTLADHYGVALDSVSYHQGGLTQPGRLESATQKPGNVDISPLPAGRTLTDMLEAGDLDAVYSAHAPAGFGRNSRIVRLFDNYREEERAYFARTRIFPIMHTVVIRRELLEAHPWVAQSLAKAFEAAKGKALDAVYEAVAQKCTLPWLVAEAEESQRIFGTRDFWPYGISENRHVLETFVRYAHEQQLIPGRPEVDELFPASTIDVARI